MGVMAGVGASAALPAAVCPPDRAFSVRGVSPRRPLRAEAVTSLPLSGLSSVMRGDLPPSPRQPSQAPPVAAPHARDSPACCTPTS